MHRISEYYGLNNLTRKRRAQTKSVDSISIVITFRALMVVYFPHNAVLGILPPASKGKEVTGTNSAMNKLCSHEEC